MPERISLEGAARELGIRLPVRVELHENMGQAKACYLGVAAGSHRIALAVGKQKKESFPRPGTLVCITGHSSSLWHELTHALQVERDYDGDSVQARHHYQRVLAERLGIEKEILTRGFLHTLVRRQLKLNGTYSRALSVYEDLPWEREAQAVAAERGNVDIEFRISRHTRRDAVR